LHEPLYEDDVLKLITNKNKIKIKKRKKRKEKKRKEKKRKEKKRKEKKIFIK
jgi:hypothetical protein